MNGSLKYAGEGIFFLGLSYRLLRWALSALTEGDAPPSAYADMPTTGMLAHPTGPAAQIAHTLMAEPSEAPIGQTAWFRAGELNAPPLPGDPALFPPEMLAAMTPEQRAHVMETLMKQRHGSAHS